MICEIAMASFTHPDQWWDTDDVILATVIDILDESEKD